MRVKDLVSLPTIKTVIQLRDTQDPEERSRLVGNFVLTQGVSFGLRVILEHVLRGQGCGAFLKGHFGSGEVPLSSLSSADILGGRLPEIVYRALLGRGPIICTSPGTTSVQPSGGGGRVVGGASEQPVSGRHRGSESSKCVSEVESIGESAGRARGSPDA